MNVKVLKVDRNCITKEDAFKALDEIYESLHKEGIAGIVILAWLDDSTHSSLIEYREPFTEHMIPDYVAGLLKSEAE